MTAPAPAYECCWNLDALTAEPRTAGHHALCPSKGRLAIEARHRAEEPTPDEIGPLGPRRAWHPEHAQAHADRDVLLAALREREEEVQRLRPIVEAVAECDPVYVGDAGEQDCALCVPTVGHLNGALMRHGDDCLRERARAALRPPATMSPDVCPRCLRHVAVCYCPGRPTAE